MELLLFDDIEQEIDAWKVSDFSAEDKCQQKERLALEKDVNKVILRIGAQSKEFKVDIKLAVQEDDLFGDIL